ncbi:MAG: phage head morphogenesis protein, partial [bacterium]|nr:phage head morphogenesis protein [bacterium]
RAPSLKKPAAKPVQSTPGTPLTISRYFDQTVMLTNSERDQLWDQVRQQPEQNFTFKRHASDLGGGHPKDIYVDPRGHEWMFKPVAAGSEFAAEAETAAYKIGRLVDDNMVEVRVVKLNGKTGTIQRMLNGLADKPDLTSFNPGNFSAIEIEQLQRHRVIDWLTSNHDGHVAQFLRTQDGHLIGIDKGQAWRYFPNDKLAIDYHPNSQFGEREPVYNTLFRMQKNGEIALTWHPMLDSIKRLEQLSDDELWSYVESYASGRYQSDSAGLRKFKLMLIDRKNNLRRDFEAYIKTVDKKFKGFDAIAAETKVSSKIADPKRKQAEELIKKVDDAGWQGVTIDFDSGDVEDMNLLVFSESVKGKPRTAVKMKLLKSADQRVHKLIKGLIDPDDMTGQPLVEDHFFDTIVSALKTIQSGSKKASKIDAATSLLNELNTLRVSSDPDIKAMAERYSYWVNVIQRWKSSGNNGLIPEIQQGEKLEVYIKMPQPKKVGHKAVSFTVKKGNVTFESRVANGRDIEVNGSRRGASQIFHRGDTSVQYQIDFGDGTIAYYTPTVTANNSLFAVNGEIEFLVDGKATPELLDRIIAHSRTLGIDGKIATDEDIELMYLLKHGYVLKDVEQAGYKQLLDNFESTKATTTERIRVLRDYWTKKMGVKDVTKLPCYQPQGVLQFGTTGGIQQAGHRVQLRFDLSDAMLEQQMPGVSLVHSLTNDYGHIAEFFDQVLAGNGTLVSTVEKLRCGVPVGGMSPAEDMSSGGASYVFTRIKSATDSRSEGIYFKKNMLRRLDAISYDHDKYGRVTGNDVIENRHSTIDGFRRCAGRSGNETIFKYTVTLLDNIEEVRVNHGKRKQMLDVFRKHGLSQLPDGRKVEQIVKEVGS